MLQLHFCNTFYPIVVCIDLFSMNFLDMIWIFVSHGLGTWGAFHETCHHWQFVIYWQVQSCDILDFEWLWSTVIDCCHGNSQWMTIVSDDKFHEMPPPPPPLGQIKSQYWDVAAPPPPPRSKSQYWDVAAVNPCTMFYSPKIYFIYTLVS